MPYIWLGGLLWAGIHDHVFGAVAWCAVMAAFFTVHRWIREIADAINNLELGAYQLVIEVTYVSKLIGDAMEATTPEYLRGKR